MNYEVSNQNKLSSCSTCKLTFISVYMKLKAKERPTLWFIQCYMWERLHGVRGLRHNTCKIIFGFLFMRPSSTLIVLELWKRLKRSCSSSTRDTTSVRTKHVRLSFISFEALDKASQPASLNACRNFKANLCWLEIRVRLHLKIVTHSSRQSKWRMGFPCYAL